MTIAGLSFFPFVHDPLKVEDSLFNLPCYFFSPRLDPPRFGDMFSPYFPIRNSFSRRSAPGFSSLLVMQKFCPISRLDAPPPDFPQDFLSSLPGEGHVPFGLIRLREWFFKEERLRMVPLSLYPLVFTGATVIPPEFFLAKQFSRRAEPVFGASHSPGCPKH